MIHAPVVALVGFEPDDLALIRRLRYRCATGPYGYVACRLVHLVTSK